MELDCRFYEEFDSFEVTFILSEKLKKVFEVILALGNYMNGARRGQAMGFKIDSLHKLKVNSKLVMWRGKS